MSFFRCPLCGLLRSPRTYDPTDYEDVIKVVYMRGKGRARGFEIIGEEILTDDTELYSEISNRLEILYHVHCGKDSTPDLLDTIEELSDELNYTKASELNRNETLLQRVNEALTETEHEENQSLSEAIDAIIGEYQDLLEEAEDELI